MADFKWGARRLSDEQQRAADEWFEDRGATHEARQDRIAQENARRAKRLTFFDDDDLHRTFSASEAQERSY